MTPALLAAVLASPADDLPRLVLADWLEERGEGERAEFIRHQIHAHNTGEREHERAMLLWALLNESRDWFADALNAVRLEWDDWGVRHDGSVGYESKHHDNEIIARRGFVSEVRCTLAAWCGGECGRCGSAVGWAIAGQMYGGSTCPTCSGTGRTPGIGPAVVAAHPVERVTLTDRAPILAPGLGRRAWLADDTMLDQVPDNCRVGLLFRWLSKTPGYADNLRVYESAELALDALSAACLAWARATPPPAPPRPPCPAPASGSAAPSPPSARAPGRPPRARR
jgi:uncharacterized protein (TIGR02996 family)